MRARRGHSTALDAIGISRSCLRLRDVALDGALSVSRAPFRTMLSSLGTAVAVATAIATVGLAESASGAVSNTFTELQATTVTFINRSSDQKPPDFTVGAEGRIDRLNGVIRAGLVWQIGEDGTLFRIGVPPVGSSHTYSLPVIAASAGGLSVIGARVLAGRLYDSGMDHRKDAVAVVGAAAARQLGITDLNDSPMIFIGNASFAVIGIIGAAPRDPDTLDAVIIPDSNVATLGASLVTVDRELVVQTSPGAAQQTGKQGAYAIDPLFPDRVEALVPIDPSQLREAIGSSLKALLFFVALIGLIVGMIVIAINTLLSVSQRRAEIGLRRSLGAAPRHITVLILCEAGMTGGIGAIMGSSLGVMVISAVCASRGWAPVLEPWLLLLTPATGAGAGLLAGLYPAWRASRVSPIHALQR